MGAENKLTRMKLREYLIDPDKFDCGISISNSSIVIMSYEKKTRWLSIPPRISLFGDGWKKLFDDAEKASKSAAEQPSEQPTPSEASLLPSTNEPQPSKLGFTISIDPSPTLEPHCFDLSLKKKTHTVGKVLCVTDCRGHEYASLKVEMETPAKQNPECFLSKPMKIVFKRAPKRDFTGSVLSDACIRSGSTVALFSRVLDQAPPRFLHVENDVFRPSKTEWSSFVIYHVLENSDPERSLTFTVNDGGFIYYGAIVKLIDSATGVASPDMRIMYVKNERVDLNLSSEDQGHPVCQAYKCAFQMLNTPNNYLSVYYNNEIVQAAMTVDNESSHRVTVDATWIVKPTDETEYRFYEAMGPVRNNVTPVPFITGIEVKEPNPSNGKTIEFSGSNFRKDHKFWFGLYELPLLTHSPERITFTLPTYAEASSPRGISFPEVNGEASFPITITRNDGVVYGTPYYFHYYLADDSGVPAVIDPCAKFERPILLRRVWPKPQDQISPQRIQLSPKRTRYQKSLAKSAPK